MSETDTTTGRPDPARSDARLVAWSVVMGMFIFLAFLGRFVAAEEEEQRGDVVYTWEFTIFGFVEFAILFGVVLLIAIGAPKRDLLALRQPTDWAVAAGLTVGVLVAVFAISVALEPLLGAGEEQGLTPERWNPDRLPQFVGALVVVGLVAPIVEELMFRGLGFSLLERFGRWHAIVITAAVFGLAHGLLRGFLPLAIFGAAVAFLRAYTRSVYPGMILHAAFNTLGMILSVAIDEERENALAVLTMLT